jgi:2-desacetyl-2-hydroxyethyl bacteriochlorophyllide A dehydrogenase
MATGVWFPRQKAVELREERLGRLEDGEVHVRAIVSGLSHGTEMLVYRGQVPPDLELDLPTLRGSYAFPIKFGYASVGRVVEVGEGVVSPRPGDLVFVHHPHQDEYVAPASLACALPAGLDPELGVFLANLETAVNVLLDAHPRIGERAVIFGLGVVGLLLTQLLRLSGVERVVAVDPVERRRLLARETGADVVLAGDEDVSAAVREVTDGRGADLAIEASGNEEALNDAIACVAFQGTVIVCSWYGTKPVRLRLGEHFHRGRVRMASSQVSTIDPALQPRWDRPRRLRYARELLSRLRLKPLISHRIPFERAAEAYRLVDEQSDQTVQVVLTYGGRS